MSGVAAVLLAAGESRRMGETNKLELLVEGKTLLRRSTETLLGSALSKTVVVIGHQAESARAQLAGLPVQSVHNARYREGQMTSVWAGLNALRGQFEGVMIALADQPLLQCKDIDRLIEAYLENPVCSVLIPVYRQQRGNPIILDFAHRDAILSGDRKLGCRRFIERNPELVSTVNVDSDHYVVDVDTPDDYAALERSPKDSSVLLCSLAAG